MNNGSVRKLHPLVKVLQFLELYWLELKTKILHVYIVHVCKTFHIRAKKILLVFLTGTCTNELVRRHVAQWFSDVTSGHYSTLTGGDTQVHGL